jgi:hypothetical protein
MGVIDPVFPVGTQYRVKFQATPTDALRRGEGMTLADRTRQAPGLTLLRHGASEQAAGAGSNAPWLVEDVWLLQAPQTVSRILEQALSFYTANAPQRVEHQALFGMQPIPGLILDAPPASTKWSLGKTVVVSVAATVGLGLLVAVMVPRPVRWNSHEYRRR